MNWLGVGDRDWDDTIQSVTNGESDKIQVGKYLVKG